MTAPAPEQIRALADWLDAFGAGTPQQAMPEELSDAADALRAAADEVDQLRAAESRMYADRAQALVSLSKQLDTNAHLLAVIDNAPHDFGCATPAESLLGVDRAPERPCTCWKASIA